MYSNAFGLGLGGAMGWFGAYMPLVLLWSLFWKGLALWHAGRKNQPWWFVVILIVNTVGILEIVYLFAILKLKFQDLFKKE
jgi:hypothetical protein